MRIVLSRSTDPAQPGRREHRTSTDPAQPGRREHLTSNAQADLPNAELLAEADSLATRLPQARLRACALVRMPEADERARGRVWLALESLQVTGSFKVRGALLALSRLAASGVRSIVAASAGNHGAGVAYAARVLGMHATVVVPNSAPLTKRERIVACGARLVVASAAGYDAAEREARTLAETTGAPFVSAYDDVAIVAGNGGSLGAEIRRALGRDPAVVIAPLGGGGLATGLACALRSSRVFGAQSEASPAFAMSLARGSAVESLEGAETLADGLEGGISRAAFERARAVVAGVAVVSEPRIAAAMASIHRDFGVVIEGSAAAAAATILESELPRELRPSHEGDVVVVLTGRNVDRAPFEAALAGAS